jgi:hypothetical protein
LRLRTGRKKALAVEHLEPRRIVPWEIIKPVWYAPLPSLCWYPVHDRNKNVEQNEKQRNIVMSFSSSSFLFSHWPKKKNSLFLCLIVCHKKRIEGKRLLFLHLRVKELHHITPDFLSVCLGSSSSSSSCGCVCDWLGLCVLCLVVVLWLSLSFCYI